MTEPATTEATPVLAGKGTLKDPIPLGTEAKVGAGFTMKIVAYNPNATALIAKANQFNDKPTAGKTYVMVTVEVAYTGDKDKDAPILLVLNAVGPSKTAYSETDTFAVEPDPKFDNFADIFSGGKSTGNVALLVDQADANGLIIYAHNGISADDVHFATS